MSSKQPSDGNRTLTDQDIARALIAMGNLPKREVEDPEAEFATYRIALDGVAPAWLQRAVESVLQGGCGHGFFPSPPELRIQCDRHAAVEAKERDRLAQAKWRCEEANRFRDTPRPSPEAKARVQALVDAFHRGTLAESQIGVTHETH